MALSPEAVEALDDATSSARLAEIARTRPALRSLVLTNAACPPDLRAGILAQNPELAQIAADEPADTADTLRESGLAQDDSSAPAEDAVPAQPESGVEALSGPEGLGREDTQDVWGSGPGQADDAPAQSAEPPTDPTAAPLGATADPGAAPTGPSTPVTAPAFGPSASSAADGPELPRVTGYLSGSAAAPAPGAPAGAQVSWDQTQVLPAQGGFQPVAAPSAAAGQPLAPQPSAGQPPYGQASAGRAQGAQPPYGQPPAGPAQGAQPSPYGQPPQGQGVVGPPPGSDDDGSSGCGPKAIGIGCLILALLLIGVVVLGFVLLRDDSGTEKSAAPATSAASTEAPSESPSASATSSSPSTSVSLVSPAPSDAGSMTSINSKTGNITCELTESSVGCSIKDRTYAKNGDQDCSSENYSIQVADGEPELACGSDFGSPSPEGTPSGDKLPYGESTAVGVMACTDRQTGMTCWNQQTGHGFTLSKESAQTF